MSGHDDGTDLAAFKDVGLGVEAQAGFLLLGSVALEAVLGQDRPDFLLEELELGGGRHRVSPGQTPGQGEACQQQEGRGFHKGSNKDTLVLFLSCQCGEFVRRFWGVREGFSFQPLG